MKKYPYIDWLPYLNSKLYAGLQFTEDERVILQQPTYFDQLEAVLKLTNKRTIANYIVWREFADYIPFLTSDLLDKAFEFFKSFSGRSVRQPRWSDCVRGVTGMLSVAVSSMYVRDYFRDERIKQDIGEIVSEISIEFEKLLLDNDWMDKETKAEALEKLHAMSSNIAYPSELLNDTIIEEYYRDLELNATNYLQSASNIDLHGKKFVCSRYHQPVNRNDWIDQSTSTFVNANYNGKSNSIRKFFECIIFNEIFFFTKNHSLYLNRNNSGNASGPLLFAGSTSLYELCGHWLRNWT